MAIGMVVEMGIFNSDLPLAIGLLMAVSGGYSDGPGERAVAGEKVATTVATSVSNSIPTQTPPTSQATHGDLKSSPPATKQERGKAAFEYPFPDREDLFLPPVKKPPTRETRPESDEDVVLMGFADVGGARVVLKIDGIVTPLRAGESRGDVRVLAIDPPKVNLQRGERQWTESLADTP